MEYTFTEKKAIFKLLSEISLSDGEAHKLETSVIINAIRATEEIISSSLKMSRNVAISTMKLMSNDKRMNFTKMMHDVLMADKIIRASEIESIKSILTAMDLTDLSQIHTDLSIALGVASYHSKG